MQSSLKTGLEIRIHRIHLLAAATRNTGSGNPDVKHLIFSHMEPCCRNCRVLKELNIKTIAELSDYNFLYITYKKC